MANILTGLNDNKTSDAVPENANFQDPWGEKSKDWNAIFRAAPDQSEIEVLKAKSKDKNLIKKGEVWSCVLRHMFARCILDEAHGVKNPITRRHRGVYCLYCPKVLFLSATPLMNRVDDYLGYLNFVWTPEWALDKLDCDIPYTQNDDVRYTEDFAQEFAERYPEQWAKMGNEPLWILEPKNFARIFNKEKVNNLTARTVLRALNELLVIRRTMATLMDIDADGETLQVGNKIAPYHISTVELAWGHPEDRARYEELYGMLIPCLNIPGAGAANGEHEARPQSDVKGMRNAKMHRLLGMTSEDTRNFKVATSHPVHKKKKKINGVVKMVSEQFSAADQYKTMALPDKGLSLYLNMAKAGPFDPVPVDRVSSAQAVASGSAKMKYVAQCV